jgi:hypothetical protein
MKAAYALNLFVSENKMTRRNNDLRKRKLQDGGENCMGKVKNA